MQRLLTSSLPALACYGLSSAFLAFTLVAGCSPVDVNETLFNCQSDADCTSGYVCDLSGTPPRCVREGSVDVMDDGLPPDGDSDANDMQEVDASPDQEADGTEDVPEDNREDMEPDIAPGEACQSDEDQRTLEEVSEEDLTFECASDCLADTACLEECIQSSIGISNACTECFVDHVICAGGSCLDPCLNGNTPDCELCRMESGCIEELEACAGPLPSTCVEGAQCGTGCPEGISQDRCACKTGPWTQCGDNGDPICIDPNTNDATVLPDQQPETCGNNIDDDCDGQIDEFCATCDPLSQNCADNEACTIAQAQSGELTAVCVPEGPVDEGDACNESLSCKAGLLCADDGSGNRICYRLCDLDGGDPQCMQGRICISIGLEGTEYEEVGVCAI